MNPIIIIIIIALVFAFLYVYPSLSETGVRVSCTDKKIIGFAKIPPPLAAVVQPEICKVNIQVQSDNSVVCITNFTIQNSDIGIIPCDSLKNFINKTLTVQSTFYTTDGTFLGNDVKTTVFNGV